MNSLFADPRRRNLAILAGIALVTVALAVLGVFHQASFTARRDRPELFFPTLVDRVRQIAHIRIRSKDGTVDVVFKPEKTWVVANKDDYPASHEQVRQTVVALATLTALEKKTARADSARKSRSSTTKAPSWRRSSRASPSTSAIPKARSDCSYAVPAKHKAGWRVLSANPKVR
jgi:hypothetical protein